MAPPVRRRVETPEELQAKIEALQIFEPKLTEPELDPRAALWALADDRARLREEDLEFEAMNKEHGSLPLQRPVPPNPDWNSKPPPTTAELEARFGQPPAPPPLRPAAPEPPPQQALAAAPEPPVEDVPPQEMGPPTLEDVLASGRDPFDPRDPIPPVYTPPPEEERPPEQEAGPTPEVVTASPRGASANTEAEHVRAATRGAAVAPAPAPSQAPPLSGDTPADPTLPPGQAPPLRRDYSDTAGRVASTPQQGARPDYFGHDDDPGFTRDARIRQAREAYDRLPERRSQQWEQEYLARNQRMGDQEIRRRGIALGLFGGYDRMREAQTDWRRGQQRYDTGLAAAQARDRGEGHISRAQAEALAATGQVSPEAAAEMRLNDPLLKQFGQFASQGGRAEHLDFQRDKMLQELLARTGQNDARYAADKELQAQKDAAALEREKLRAEKDKAVAATYAARRKAEKENENLSPDDKRDLVGNFLFNTYRDQGLTDEVSLEAARGVFSNVPPAIRERVQSDARGMNVFKTRSDFRTAAMGTTAAGAKGNIAAENAERTARSTIHLKPQQIKEDKDITLLAADVRRAAQAWSKMPQSARDAYVQNGRNMPEAIKSKQLGPYQAQAGDLEKLLGQIRRTTLGLAQTIPELDGLATEMGKAADTWDPFKGSGAFERAMERVLQEARLRKKLLNNLSQPRQGRE